MELRIDPLQTLLLSRLTLLEHELGVEVLLDWQLSPLALAVRLHFEVVVVQKVFLENRFLIAKSFAKLGWLLVNFEAVVVHLKSLDGQLSQMRIRAIKKLLPRSCDFSSFAALAAHEQFKPLLSGRFLADTVENGLDFVCFLANGQKEIWL